MRDAVIIQSSWGDSVFHDMMRLSYQRHAAYARAQDFDYWHINGHFHPESYPGGWDKVHLIKLAMEQYSHIVWIDADAAIFDFETNLRDALKDKPFDIGACIHDAPHFKEQGMGRHMNVGVMYVRNTERSRKFIDEWLSLFPGERRWQEQGVFNKLIKDNDVVGQVEDKWNATVNVNEVDNPVVKGWHGLERMNRFYNMKADMITDHIRFRV